MLQCVKESIRQYDMLKGVTEVTVALSGGADSVALLSAMLELKQEFGFSVSAAHLNHCLRGEESDRDEQFVRKLCESLKVPLFCERADVLSVAKRDGLSIELAARNVRYDFLRRVSKGVVATAHTASDNIETVLHNAVRGTGITGLCGIPPKRELFIRPLIGVTREQVEAYCREKGLSFCVDSTNSDQTYTRNRIRHSVVPELLKVNSAAVKNVSQLSATLREDADFLNAEATKTFEKCAQNGGLSVEDLKECHPAIAKRCIALLFEQETGTSLERQHINAVLQLLNSDSGKQSVRGDYAAMVKNKILKFCAAKTEKLSAKEVDMLPFEHNNIKVCKFGIEEFKNLLKFNNLLLNNAADCGKICGKLILRGRKAGDKITLEKRQCTKTFKKLFNENGLDEQERDRLQVVSDDNGVVWLNGFGIDARVAVDENTTEVLVFQVVNNVPEGSLI